MDVLKILLGKKGFALAALVRRGRVPIAPAAVSVLQALHAQMDARAPATPQKEIYRT
jgi:hypothetical protein